MHTTLQGMLGKLRCMRTVCRTLQASLQNQRSENDVDGAVLKVLGDITGPQKWLVASLDKTIRLQLEL